MLFLEEDLHIMLQREQVAPYYKYVRVGYLLITLYTDY